jgi:hypothetical protein
VNSYDKTFAKGALRSLLFQGVWQAMLEIFTLRWTDARDVCKEMADRGIILRTWKSAGWKRNETGRSRLDQSGRPSRRGKLSKPLVLFASLIQGRGGNAAKKLSERGNG